MRSHGHLRSVEGARGLAALGILVYHVGVVTAPHGWLYAGTSRLWLGVPLFFVLSGFLLYRPFVRATVRGISRPSLGRYVRARVLRIAPLYWLVLAAAMSKYPVLWPAAIGAAGLFLLARAYVARSLPVLLLATALLSVAVVALARAPHDVLSIALTNFFLVYIPLGVAGVVGPAWSLCIEVSFYVLLPIVAVAADRFARGAQTPTRRARRLAFVLALAFPIGWTYVALVATGGAPVWLPTFVAEFAAGMLLAVALEVRPAASVRMSRLLLGAAAAIACAANLLFTVGLDRPYGNGSGELFALLMAVAFALALASVLVRAEETALGRMLGSGPLNAAGVVSYGLFLWHWPLIQRLQDTSWWYGLNGAGQLLVVLGGTFGLAAASWFVVEQPSLRAKNRAPRTRQRSVPAPVAEPVPTVAPA